MYLAFAYKKLSRFAVAETMQIIKVIIGETTLYSKKLLDIIITII